jgi:hypothetical protein
MMTKLETSWSLMSRYSRLYKRHIIGLALCAIIGVLSAIIDAGDTLDMTNQSGAWSLPSDNAPILLSNLDVMLAEPLFGGEPIKIELPQSPENIDGPILEDWRLVGIVTEGEHRQIAIVNQVSGKLLLAVPGDTLPGGEELLVISDNEIEIGHTSGIRKISLFKDIER